MSINVSLPAEVIEDLVCIFRYSREDEEKHYEAMVERGEDASNHIFLRHRRVKEWLEKVAPAALEHFATRRQLLWARKMGYTVQPEFETLHPEIREIARDHGIDEGSMTIDEVAQAVLAVPCPAA